MSAGLVPRRWLLLLPLLAMGSAGCFTMRAELPGVLRDDVKPADTENLGPLVVEQQHWFLLHGFFGKTPRDFLSGELKAAVQKRGGDGVAGLKYVSEQSCADAAIGTCTFGCVVPRTYRITGTVVRIRAPRLPGRPAKLVEAGAVLEPARVAQAY